MNKIVKKNIFCTNLKRVMVVILSITCFMTILMNGCNKEESGILLTVYADPMYSVQTSANTGDVTIHWYLVVSEEDSEVKQQFELNAIEHFAYEEGYEYLLKVKKIFDNSSFHYSLIKLVSKTKMDERNAEMIVTVYDEAHNNDFESESLVLKESESEILVRYFLIEGFQYEKGFLYQLKVKKHTPVPLPSHTGIRLPNLYTFIEIISKSQI